MNPMLFPGERGNPLLAAGEYINEAAGRRRAEREARREEIGNRLLQTWPAEAVRAAYEAVTLPGDVYAGRVDPMSDEGIGRAAELAGLVTLGSAAMPAPRGALTMGAARRGDDLPPAHTGIRAYHGSPHRFDEFDLEESRSGYPSAWFSTHEDTARDFGVDRMPEARHRSSAGRATLRPNMYEVEIGGRVKDIDVMAEARRDAEIIGAPPPETWEDAAALLQWASAQNTFLDEAVGEGFDAVRFRNVGDSPSQAVSDHIAVINPDVIRILRVYGVASLAALPASALIALGMTREQAAATDARLGL